MLTVLVFWSCLLLQPRLPPSSQSLRLFPCASVLLHGPLDICLYPLPAAPLAPARKRDARHKFLQHRSASSKTTTEFAQPGLSRSNGGHPQREGTNLGVFVPIWLVLPRREATNSGVFNLAVTSIGGQNNGQNLIVKNGQQKPPQDRGGFCCALGFFFFNFFVFFSLFLLISSCFMTSWNPKTSHQMRVQAIICDISPYSSGAVQVRVGLELADLWGAHADLWAQPSLRAFGTPN